MTERYNITITIKGIETHSIEKLEREVWAMCKMIAVMSEISEPDVIKSYYSVSSSLEAVKE